MLENLNFLARIEANKGQNSTVQQAFAILDSEHRFLSEDEQESRGAQLLNLRTFPNIVDFLFRNPRSGIDTVSKFCPNLKKVRLNITSFSFLYLSMG